MVKKKKVGKEVCETFEIEKDGKEKIEKVCGTEEIKHASKKEIERQNKTLYGFFLFMGIVIVAIFAWYGISYYLNHFEYGGVKFDIVKTPEVTFYHTSFPIYQKNQKVDYNVYLRKDPRKNILDFEGDSKSQEMVVLKSDENLSCAGDGGISILNMQQIFRAMGMQIIADPNATCDSEGRYMHITLLGGEENKIVEYGPSCYELQVKDCEILDVTERFILEFVKKVA